MLRAAAIVERLGVPTASIIGSGFLKQAEVILKGIGVPLAIGVYPGAPMVDSEAELLRKVEESLADRKSTRLNSSHSQQSRMPSSA